MSSDDREMLPAIVERAALRGALAVPAAIDAASDNVARRVLEFFAAQIRNRNTRLAYHRAVCTFFAWLDRHDIRELADI